METNQDLPPANTPLSLEEFLNTPPEEFKAKPFRSRSTIISCTYKGCTVSASMDAQTNYDHDSTHPVTKASITGVAFEPTEVWIASEVQGLTARSQNAMFAISTYGGTRYHPADKHRNCKVTAKVSKILNQQLR